MRNSLTSLNLAHVCPTCPSLGIETSAAHGGAEPSSASAIIMIAKLDRDYTLRAYCKYSTSEHQEDGCLCLHSRNFIVNRSSVVVDLLQDSFWLDGFCLPEPASAVQFKRVYPSDMWAVHQRMETIGSGSQTCMQPKYSSLLMCACHAFIERSFFRKGLADQSEQGLP